MLQIERQSVCWTTDACDRKGERAVSLALLASTEMAIRSVMGSGLDESVGPESGMGMAIVVGVALPSQVGLLFQGHLA